MEEKHNFLYAILVIIGVSFIGMIASSYYFQINHSQKKVIALYEAEKYQMTHKKKPIIHNKKQIASKNDDNKNSKDKKDSKAENNKLAEKQDKPVGKINAKNINKKQSHKVVADNEEKNTNDVKFLHSSKKPKKQKNCNKVKKYCPINKTNTPSKTTPTPQKTSLKLRNEHQNVINKPAIVAIPKNMPLARSFKENPSISDNANNLPKERPQASVNNNAPPVPDSSPVGQQ